MSLPLPEPLLISNRVTTQFLYPRSKSYPLTESWENGGVALNDSSEELTKYVWQAWTDGTTITVKRDDLATETVLITDSNITEVDLTFDQNMNPCIAYVANGISKLYWYDSLRGMQVIDEYPLITNPRVSLDDKRRVNVANSDIIFAYISKDNKVKYRIQRERFSIEHDLVFDREGFEGGIALNAIGMGIDNRFIFSVGFKQYGEDIKMEQPQLARLAYPEAAWIALCGNKFPSSVQWLYKYLAKTDIVFDKDIPPLSNTSSIVINDKAVVGSGKTSQGVPIHEQVSVDWVKWAISQRVWKTLYTQNKINATQGGIDLIVNEIKYILDIAVEQGIFTQYKIGETKLDRNTNNLQVKFTANLTHTILEVEVNGSLKY